MDKGKNISRFQVRFSQMKSEIETIRDAIKSIKTLAESDLKHEALLVLNIMLSDSIIHTDWVSYFKKDFTI